MTFDVDHCELISWPWTFCIPMGKREIDAVFTNNWICLVFKRRQTKRSIVLLPTDHNIQSHQRRSDTVTCAMH